MSFGRPLEYVGAMPPRMGHLPAGHFSLRVDRALRRAAWPVACVVGLRGGSRASRVGVSTVLGALALEVRTTAAAYHTSDVTVVSNQIGCLTRCTRARIS